MRKTVIHVNRNKLQQNSKHGTKVPVITAKDYKTNRYGHRVIIKDKDGNPVAQIIQRENNPLSCGAKVWIETYNEVEVITDEAI